MNLASCQYLIKIAEHGSLSNAAVVLGVTQSALSRAIREMETELGVSVFHRDGRGVSLTEDGKLVLEAAQSVSSALIDLRSTLETNKGMVAREVRVGFLPSTAKLLSVPMMARLREDFPGTRMQISEGATGHLAEWLNDGRLDLAITNDSPAIKRFNPEPVVTHRLHLAAARSAPRLPREIPFSELANYPIVLQTRNHSTRREVEHIAHDQNVRINITAESDSLTAMTQLISAGFGYGLIPHFAVDYSTMQSSVVTNPGIERTICLVTPLAGARSRGLSPMIRSFRNEIRAVYQRFSDDQSLMVPTDI
ncbi:LysR family transcriptional regulator [Neorhizobium alkalisoli]|uniref:HTH-type transcriptional regulator TtuA n=1 Tax=Neorhizobium alkalisoli TaxID=528178 RepID=A0A561Q7T1_9HYPH|nr:LysR family transcriptional regulator [Neorhizobium alkalisoli]TWF46444.1 LysR family transcriptional regulator [Neorhizobium alkalisoli]